MDANRLFNDGRFAEAEHAYFDVLTQRPNAAWAIYRIGEIRLKGKDSAGAREHFARAIALQPALIEAHIGLGRTAEQTGDGDAAAHFRKALELSPSVEWLNERIAQLSRDAPALFWRQFKHANELLENRNFAEAEPIFKDLLARDASCAPVLAKLGRIAGQYGRFDDALDLYERAVAADGAYVWGYIGQAEILDGIGELDSAVQALEAVLSRDASMTLAQDRLQALRQKQRLQEQGPGTSILHWPASRESNLSPAGKTRVAVVAWCLAHNPVGRAMTLAEIAVPNADVEIVGPIFPSYGDGLWEPLRVGERAIPIRGFHAPTFTAFMEGAIRLVKERPCDIAWVSKPRLPSLLIGFLYKLIHGAALIVDIDDDELAFVRADGPLTLEQFLSEQRPADWTEPHGKRWTQLAVSMAGLADAITVCNPVLQEKFGGTIIRHARDADAFRAARGRRAMVRAEFGFRDSDKIVLFLGTPRRHKGVLDVARALQQVGDPNAVFCIVGTVRDKELKKELEALTGVRVALHPDQPYARVADLNAMADIVCILQDPADPIAHIQTPAKLTDAIASGTVILATAVPPIADLIEGGKIRVVSDASLVDALRVALRERDRDRLEAAAQHAFFEVELSVEANATRAAKVFETARRSNGAVPGDAMRLFQHIDACMPGALSPDSVKAAKGAFRIGPRVGPLRTLHQDVNVVFFWKQNDSSLFGRRQDMLLAEFAAQPNIRKILHIDAPISADKLIGLAQSTAASADQGRFIAANTTSRFLGTLDDDRVARRTFVYRGKETHLLGHELPPVEAFPNAVEAWLNDLGMTENVFAWVCPVVRGFGAVQNRIGFSFVAADVIDDQRQWPMQPLWRSQIEKAYAETFAVTDAAFANCQPVADWLSREKLQPLVVPNAMDVPDGVDTWNVPSALARLPRPIVGYCGNLTHRLDWGLIEAIAEARPQWSFVLIGEPPDEDGYRRAVARSNVHALGVLPYASAQRHIAAFDAAMIPHVRSALSDHMNPLKLYVYRGLGVPVVSTPVANLDDLANDIAIAPSTDAFVAKLAEAIERRRQGRIFPPREMMRTLSWKGRAQTIWARLEAAFEARRDAKARGIAA